MRWAAGKLQKAPAGPRGAFKARLKALGKRPADGQSCALGRRKAAKGAGKGAAEGLKRGCLTLLSEASRKALHHGQVPGRWPKSCAGQPEGTGCGALKGRLLPITLLSEATRKALGKRPADGQSRALSAPRSV